MSHEALNHCRALEEEKLRKRIAELEAEVERLENITALGVHTCNATCKRPMCVLRREKAKLEAEVEELNKFIAGQDEQISKLWKNRTL